MDHKWYDECYQFLYRNAGGIIWAATFLLARGLVKLCYVDCSGLEGRDHLGNGKVH